MGFRTFVLACIFSTSLLIPSLGAKVPIPESMNTLFLFTGDQPSPAWGSTNDGVMGGLSKGSAELVEHGMVFSGVLSLENNGGFSSIYIRDDFDLSDASGICLKVLGDGRTYQLRLEGDAVYRERWPVSFRGTFETVVNEWIEVVIPFDYLEQTWRGRELSGYEFSKDDVRRLSLMLADKQRGEFSLKVAWIKAY
jgi:NADH dehydrogenase [ubiquinone] 1 alpha subcomplex assembly factor 1